jgi:hypothetical protein
VLVEHYPLPIAQEYHQLLEMQTWWDKCQQLKDVLSFSLRYCVLIAVSDYLTGQLQRTDPDLNAWLPSKLIEPTLDDLYEMLHGVMKVYHQNDPSLLMVRELYDFCCDSTGTRTSKMQEIKQLIDGFAKELPRLRSGDEEQLRELYEEFEPRLKGVLANLSFLKDYQLLRIYGADALPSGYQWQVRVLMGSEIDTMVQRWPMPRAPERHGVGLWDGARQKLLMLYPFALFDKSEKYTQAFYSPAEELYLYDKAREARVIYVGRKPRGLSHRTRIPTERTLTDLRDLLGQGSWPLVVEVAPPGPPEAVRVLDWRRLRGLAANQSQGQLELYRKEKYRAELYLQREMVEGDFQAFLEGDKNGFLVVGDSGTGKTNLLCHWVKEALEREEAIVLFYNCAELPTGEGSNLGDVVASRLKLEHFGALLAKLEHERAERGGRFFLVLDGLNEHQAPLTLLNSLQQDVLKEVPAGLHDWFRVVVSCRTEAWRRLERHFREVGLFHQTADGIGVQLPQFTAEELPAVYEKYREKHRLQTEFGELSEATKRFIADPLMLKFVAESYAEQELPPDPRTVDVFDRYLKEKVGDPDDSEMDQQEKEVVARLVELMYHAKRAELSERELEEDEVIGQAVLASQDVRSPYFRLLDKGVLTQVEVGRAVPAAAALFGGERVGPETRVRFTYDRFFEHLLAFYVMPGEVTVERIRQLLEEADRARFVSLWGATKARLITYMEQTPDAPDPSGVVVQLARDADHKQRGLLADALITQGITDPQRVSAFLRDDLLPLDSDSAGLVALLTAHQLKDTRTLKRAFSLPSGMVSQTAMHLAYHLWSRQREEGAAFLDELSRDASHALLRPGEVMLRFRGEGIDLQRLPSLNALLGISLRLCANLVAEPEAIPQFARVWLRFYEGVPRPLRGIVVNFVKRFVGDALVEAHRRNPTVSPITLDTLSIFTRRPLDSPVRVKVRECAEYLTAEVETKGIADDVFEMGQYKDGAIGLVVMGVLISHIRAFPEQALELLQRMYYEGNMFSKYSVFRALSVALEAPHPPPGLVDFFSTAILDAWNNEEPTVEIEGRLYRLGHLASPMFLECRQKVRGRLDFVDRFMEQSWSEGRIAQIGLVLEQLAVAGLLAVVVQGVHPYPVLDTLQQWFDFRAANKEETRAVQRRLADALAFTWVSFPDIVEAYLEDQPELKVLMLEALRPEPGQFIYREALNNLMTAAITVPKTASGLATTIQRICDEVTDVEVALKLVGAYLVDVDTLTAMAEEH